MTKRIRQQREVEDEGIMLFEDKIRLPLLQLPDDMIFLILSVLKTCGLYSIFFLRHINRHSRSRFQSCLSLFYPNGFTTCSVSRNGRVEGIPCDQIVNTIGNQIKTLDLFRYNDSGINGDTVHLFRNLEQLRLYSLFYIEIKDLVGLSRLTKLDLSYNTNSLCTRNTSIPLLTNLKSLCLSHNISVRDDELRLMTGLTCLDVSFNGLISDYSIKELTSLESINVRGVTRNITAYSITRLTNLRELTASWTTMRDVSNLKNLSKLKMYIGSPPNYNHENNPLFEDNIKHLLPSTDYTYKLEKVNAFSLINISFKSK